MSVHRGAGAKYDLGKIYAHSILRYFPRALEQVARVSEYGSHNHGWDTYHTIADGEARYADAQIRHELSICRGETHDHESGLLHLSHEAWNILARLELAMRREESDANGINGGRRAGDQTDSGADDVSEVQWPKQVR